MFINEKDYVSTGQIFKKYREKNKDTRQSMGERLGCTGQYLGNIEKDNGKPSKELLNTFFEEYQVSIDDQEMVIWFEDFRKTPDRIRQDFFYLVNKVNRLQEALKKERELNKFGRAFHAFFSQYNMDEVKELMGYDFNDDFDL